MSSGSAGTTFQALFAGMSASSKSSLDRNASFFLTISRRGFAWGRGAVGFAVALMLLAAFGVSGQAQSLTPVWNQQSPATNPPPRFLGALTYDAAHNQMVLFGGDNSNDTWLWNGANWGQSSFVAPSNLTARQAEAMVYDAAHGNVVMFGGLKYDLGQLNDTWLWDGTSWTQSGVSAASSPSPRNGAVMVYDAALGEVVLFGGTSNGSSVNDTWTWNGTTWTNVTPANSPPARANYGMAYDAAHGQVVLFGGTTNASNLADTWTWNGSTWTQQSPVSSPPARSTFGMAYNAALGQVVLFGGSNGNPLNDTWLWNGSNWTEVSSQTNPAARYALNAMAYDSALGQVILFSGMSPLADTWEFGLPTNFGNVNVCPSGQSSPAPCTETVALTYNLTTSTTFGATRIVTQGTTNLDFTLAPSGSTCNGLVPAGTSCTVNVTFTPLAPGLRMGAVQLLADNGSVISSTPIYGNGQGPAVAFGPGSQSTVDTGSYPLAAPKGVAVDAAGNIYISDNANQRVVKVGVNGTQTALGSALQYPQGLAVDGAGNLFIADNNLNQVVEVPAGCTNSGCQVVVASPTCVLGVSGLCAQLGVAVSGTGDVFISSYNSEVLKVSADAQTVVYNPPGSHPIGLAVDAASDLFVADFGLAKVVKIPAGCTSSSCQTTVGTGWVQPEAVAVDAAGDVFVADEAPKVIEVPAGCTSSSCQVTISNDLAYGVAVDAKGNLFVAEPFSNRVLEFNRSQAPSLSFDTTSVGSSSAPLSVTLQNIGNQTLTAISPGWYLTSPNFQPGQPIDCSTDYALAPGESCQQNFVFWPVTSSGPLSASLVFTDNALNGAPATHTIALSGTALNSPQFLTVTGAGTGNGSVSSNPTGIACNVLGGVASGTCAAQFVGATQVGLQEIPTAGSTFAGWGGACASYGTNQQCIVTVNAATSVSANFTLVPTAVTVPNVVGLTQVAATTAFGQSLTLGATSTEASSTVASGNVISQNPAAGAQVPVGSAIALLISSGPQATSNPLTLQNNYFVTGDYASAGVTLRGTGVGGMATGTITIPSSNAPGGLGVPDGADIVEAFLYWQTVESTPTASGSSGTFDRFPITGQQIGNDLPYTDGALSGTLRVYRADVNAYFVAQANGVRYASGAHTVALPDAGGASLPLTEGASLVVIYRVMSQNFPLKSVVIYDGAAVPVSSAPQAVKGFYDAVGGASGTGKVTSLFAAGGSWNNSTEAVTLGQADQYTTTLNPSSAYAAVILSTPVSNADNDGILDAWKSGPPSGDFHAGQPGYYDVKTGSWVGLPGALHGQKDLFVQLDYMCGGVLSDGSCDPTKENLFPSPDAQGKDPLAIVQQAFTTNGIHLHLQIGNAVPEDICTDSSSSALCQFPNQPGVIGWKNSLEFSKLWPRNLQSCATGGDCTARFPYGQKDSYHYVLFGHSLAVPAWNTRYGTLTAINVGSGVTTISTADRGTGINACPSRITLSGVLGNPSLNGVYNTASCSDSKTIKLATPGVPDWNYPNNTLPEPVIGLTSGTVTSISGYSDLGGADSAVTLGLWLTAPNQDMSKRANVVAGTLFHEIGHTLGLSHGGLYYDSPGSYVPTFEANCKPNYQSSMNYLFQLDGVGPNEAVAFSNQTLNPLNESAAGSVGQLTASGIAATFATSAWYVPYISGVSTASPATRHCDGSTLNNDSAYRVDAAIAPITPAWANGQDINFDGQLNAQMRGYNDEANVDLRQLGATGGQFASLASVLSFGSSAAPLNIGAGGNVTLGSGGTVALGSGGNVTLGSGGNVTLGSGGTITLGSGGNVTLGSGGNVTLGSGGTVTPGSDNTVTLSIGGNVTLGSGGDTITLASGGNITLGSGGNVTLGSGGTIIDSTGTYVLGAGGTYLFGSSGGNVILGSGGNVTLGSGGNVTLGSGGNITLGSGGNVTLGSGGNITLGSGGVIALGSGGNVTLGSGGNVTLGSGGTITLGSGGNVTLGSGGNVTLGSGGTVTLGSGGVSSGSGGNITLGSGGNVTLGSGGTVTLGSGGNVTLGSGGNVTLGRGGTITLGSGGNITLGSGGNVTLGSGGTVIDSTGTHTIIAGGTYTFGSGGGNVILGSGGNVTLGSGGNVTLGSGGTITMGSGGNITLGSGGNVTLGSGGVVTLGSGGNVTLGSGGTIALGSGGNVTLGSGGALTNELTYETANSVVRPPSSPTETPGSGVVRVDWTAPAFGVVQTYAIYRSSDGATPILIGSVSGDPPATEFIDTNPDTTASTVMYTITTILVPDASEAPRQSPASVPAVVKNDQTIVLAPLPSSVPLSQSTVTVSATALSGGNPNGLQVNFSATGSCSVGSQSVASIGAGGASSATINLSNTGSCTITASQPGTDPSQSGAAPFFNPASAVSGSFAIVPQNSSLTSQTINWAPLPNKQYGDTFSLSATASSGETVSFVASGPCHADGTITGIGICKVTASTPGDSTYSPASVTQSFTIFPAVIKVTADNLSIAFGQPLPLLTYKYSGFVNNESASVVSGAPVLSTTATTASIVGNYPITVATGTLAAANYSFLYVTGTLAIQQASQSITFSTNAPSSAAYNTNFTVAAGGGGSGNPVTFTSSGSCSNAGATYTMTSGAGICSVIANQAGNTNYAAATQVTQTVSATPANQAALRLTTTSPLTYNQTETMAVSGGTTGGAVTFAITGSCAVTGLQLKANSGTGSCSVTATMAGNTNYNAVTSTPANFVALSLAAQSITFTTNPPASAAYNSTFTVAASSTSLLPVTFTSGGACTNVGATYTMTNSTGTCSVIASQAGNTNYAAAVPVTKPVTATGPLVSLSTSAIDFGTVYFGSITTKTITVRNIGNAPVTIKDPLLSVVKGGNSNEFVAVNLCLLPLAAGKSCTITIAFVAGPYYTPQTAALQIVDNAPGSPQAVTLTALVINPLANFSPTSLSFGTVKHGTSSTLNVTLSNPGGTPLVFSGTGISVTGTSAKSFVQTNNCGSSLVAGAKCSIAIKFTPATTGTFTANLSVVDNAQAGGGTQTVPLSGKGN